MIKLLPNYIEFFLNMTKNILKKKNIFLKKRELTSTIFLAVLQNSTKIDIKFICFHLHHTLTFCKLR